MGRADDVTLVLARGAQEDFRNITRGFLHRPDSYQSGLVRRVAAIQALAPENYVSRREWATGPCWLCCNVITA